MEVNGYKMQTTFWMDFTIADKFGENSIYDTYRRAVEGWKNNAKYMTELTLVLNWKIWQHHEKGNDDIAVVYDKLWRDCDNWCCENLKDEDLEYHYRVTD